MITKKIVLEYTQKKMRKEFKHFTVGGKKPQKKTVSNTGNEEGKALWDREDKQHDSISNSLLISNYFKHKWTQLSSQKTEIGRMD